MLASTEILNFDISTTCFCRALRIRDGVGFEGIHTVSKRTSNERHSKISNGGLGDVGQWEIAIRWREFTVSFHN
jgi:hypothetical protein